MVEQIVTLQKFIVNWNEANVYNEISTNNNFIYHRLSYVLCNLIITYILFLFIFVVHVIISY